MNTDRMLLLGVTVVGLALGLHALRQAKNYRNEKSKPYYTNKHCRSHRIQPQVQDKTVPTAENPNNGLRSYKMFKKLKQLINRCLNKNATTEIEDIDKPTEYFAEVTFLNTSRAEIFQLEKVEVQKLRSALDNDERGMLIFDTKMKRRCVINLELVVTVNIYRDERLDIGMPIEGVYIRLLGQDKPFCEYLEPEPLVESLTKREKVFAADNGYYINRQTFLMAAYELGESAVPS